MKVESRELFQQLEKSLSSQNFHPVYFFFGDEPYLVQSAAKYLQTIALQGVPADFNARREMAPDFNANNLRDEIETLPMMASRRFVWLQQAHEVSESQWAELEPVIKTPVPTTVWLITGQKMDQRKKVFKLLLEQAISVEFRKPFENQMTSWIRQIAKGHALQFSDEALQLFHRLAGQSLSEIDAEIVKLKDFLGARQQIELADVASSVSRAQEHNIFHLVELIFTEKKSESLVALAELLGQGQNEVGFVSLFARHVRTLLRLREAEEQGLSGQKLSQVAQVPSYFLPEYQKQTRLWSKRRLQSALALAADTEQALKSSPVSSHLWLENLVLNA